MNTLKDTKDKNNRKRTQINIRMTQGEKKKLNEKAMKSGLSLSEYIRMSLSRKDGKRQNPETVAPCVVVRCQDILNIVEEKYSCEDNSMLEEKVEGLWKLLSNS